MRIRICFAIISLLFTSTVLSALPPYIDKDTFKEICRNVSCPEGFNPKYISTYFHKTFHKALALSVNKKGNKYIIDHISWSWEYGSYSAAKRAAINGCLKKSNNCEIFLVNNNYANESLYNRLIKSSSSNNKIPANSHKSGTSWVCNTNYYRNNAKTACLYVPANSTSSYSSNIFKCNTGYSKSGNRCVKNNTIPANAYKSGNSWKCFSSYYKSNNYCAKLPSNASAFGSGDGFYCKSGYKKIRTKMCALKLK